MYITMFFFDQAGIGKWKIWNFTIVNSRDFGRKLFVHLVLITFGTQTLTIMTQNSISQNSEIHRNQIWFPGSKFGSAERNFIPKHFTWRKFIDIDV